MLTKQYTMIKLIRNYVTVLYIVGGTLTMIARSTFNTVFLFSKTKPLTASRPQTMAMARSAMMYVIVLAELC